MLGQKIGIFASRFLFTIGALLGTSLSAPNLANAYTLQAEEGPVFRYVRFSELRDSDLQAQRIGRDFQTQVEELLNAKGELNEKHLLALRFQSFPAAKDSATGGGGITPAGSASAVEVKVVGFAQPVKGQERYIKAVVNYDTQTQRVTDIKEVKAVSIANTKFKMRVGFFQLKAVIEDQENDIKILVPTSGPALDMGMMPRTGGKNILLTPIIEGVLDKRPEFLTEHRTSPEYYKGEPFVSIAYKGNRTLYGFHISPWTDDLERGFYSAGCVRLRRDDLHELFSIVKFGAQAGVPVTLGYTLEEKDDHPYPKILDSYQVVYQFKCIYDQPPVRARMNTQVVKGLAPLEQLEQYRGMWPTSETADQVFCQKLRSKFKAAPGTVPDPESTHFKAFPKDLLSAL